MTSVTLTVKKASYVLGGKPLLREITTEAIPGRVHALIGPNGAGKSTLLKLMAGDIKPTSGDVYVNDVAMGQYSKQQLARHRAVMPQDVVISLDFTGEEVVMMGRYPHMGDKNGRHHGTVVNEMMQRTETGPLRDRLYPHLSGGEQARVTLARVLAQEAPLLFLDEPTASLDPRHQHLVMALARSHAKAGGTVLAVLHDLNLAAAYADDIILLRDGQVRAQGAPTTVLQPDILQDVFKTTFSVTDHPALPHPLVLSLPMLSRDDL